MGRETVIYDDFSGGEWGPTQLTRVPKTMYSGLNVQTYADGQLGPRNQVVQLSPTGIPTTATTRPQILFARDGKIFFIVDSTVYFMSSYRASTLTTVTGTVVGGASSSAAQLYTDLRLSRYWINRVGVGFGYVSGSTWTTVATPVNFRMIAVKGERMVGCEGTVIYFSAAGDFTSWPALNQIDIGEGSYIQWMHTSGDTLYVATEASLYAVQGTLGSTTTVRLVASTGARSLYALGNATSMSQEPWRAAKLADDTIAWVAYEDFNAGAYPFMASANTGKQGMSRIAWFAGGTTKLTDHFDYVLGDQNNSTDSYEVFHCAGGDRLFLFPMGGRLTSSFDIYALGVMPSGQSEAHKFTIATDFGGTTFGGANTPLRFYAGPQAAWDRSAAGGPPLLGFVTWDGTNCKFWYWNPNPGRGNTTVSGEFYVAPYFAPDGSLCRVRGVTVYGTLFDASQTSTLTVQSQAFSGVSQTDLAMTQDSAQSLNPNTFSSGGSGNVEGFAFRFNFGNASWGRGCSAKITLTKCAVSKVVLDIETKPAGDYQ